MFKKLKKKIEEETSIHHQYHQQPNPNPNVNTQRQKQSDTNSNTSLQKLNNNINNNNESFSVDSQAPVHNYADRQLSTTSTTTTSIKRPSTSSLEDNKESKLTNPNKININNITIANDVDVKDSKNFKDNVTNDDENVIDILNKRTKQVKDLSCKINELMEQLKEKNETIIKLESALEMSQDVCEDKLKQLNERYNRERSRMQDVINQAVSQKEFEMNLKIEELKKKLEKKFNYGKPLTHQQQPNSDSALKINQLEEELSESRSTIAELTNKIKEVNEKFNKMSVTYNNNGEDDDWLERQIESESELSKLQDHLDASKKRLVELEEENKLLLVDLKTKEDKNIENNKQMLLLKSELQQKQSTLTIVEENLSTKGRMLTDLDRENQQLKNDVEKLRSTNMEHEQRAIHLQQQINSLQQQQKDVSQQNEDVVRELKHKISLKETEYDDLNNKLGDVERNRDERLKSIEEDVMMRMKMEMGSLEEQLKEKIKIIKKQEQKLQDLKKMLQRELTTNNSTSATTTTLSTFNNNNTQHTINNSATFDSVGVFKNQQFQHLHNNSFNISENNNADLNTDSDYDQYLKNTQMTSTTFNKMLQTTTNNKYGDENENINVDELNFKYLKHVLLKFLLSREHEALQLIKVLSTLLRFDGNEEQLLRETLKWKASWFRSKPNLPEKGQTSIVVPPTY